MCNAKAAAACESSRLEAETRPKGVWAQIASIEHDGTACDVGESDALPVCVLKEF